MDCLTDEEKQFFTGNPDQQAIVNMIWKYESYWVLLWALGKVKNFSYPSQICDYDFAIKFISECNTYEQFMKNVKLRDIEDILDETDLNFRYDWVCVDARIKGMEAPQGLDAGVVSIVYRDKEKGTSKFVSFIDIDDFPKILAAGGLGNAMIDNSLISTIKKEKRNADYSWLGV